MFFATVTDAGSERRGQARRGGEERPARNLSGNPARSPEAVSTPQIMRLAVFVLLAAFCIGLSGSPRSGHAEENRTSHAFGAKAPRTAR